MFNVRCGHERLGSILPIAPCSDSGFLTSDPVSGVKEIFNANCTVLSLVEIAAQKANCEDSALRPLLRALCLGPEGQGSVGGAESEVRAASSRRTPKRSAAGENWPRRHEVLWSALA